MERILVSILKMNPTFGEICFLQSHILFYKTAEQGASIFRSISHGHMFVDGNKRTAVQAFMYFAKQNGLKTVPVQQIYNIANKVATGQITEVSQISKMLVK